MSSANWPALNVWVFVAQLVEHCSSKKEYTQKWLNDQNSVSLSSRGKITFKGEKIVSIRKLSRRNKKPSLQDKPHKTKVRGPVL